jgi:hypothetical protein
MAEVPLNCLARATPPTESAPSLATRQDSPLQDGTFDIGGPTGDLTRAIIDRVVAAALREDALDPPAPTTHHDRAFRDEAGRGIGIKGSLPSQRGLVRRA